MNIQRNQKSLEETLSSHLKKKVTIRLNRNTSTMLSVLESTEESCRLSVHRRFLLAPEEIIDSVSQFISQKTGMPLLLKRYIQSDQDLDQSLGPKRSSKKQEVQGRFFDLSQILSSIEKEYFGTSLGLQISWYGKQNLKKPSQCRTLGLFDCVSKTIKIHRTLDDDRVPLFYIKFVVFHEIMHFLYPPKVSKNGRIQFHHAEFRNNEQKFSQYKEAIDWEKNQSFWFDTVCEKLA